MSDEQKQELDERQDLVNRVERIIQRAHQEPTSKTAREAANACRIVASSLQADDRAEWLKAAKHWEAQAEKLAEIEAVH